MPVDEPEESQAEEDQDEEEEDDDEMVEARPSASGSTQHQHRPTASSAKKIGLNWTTGDAASDDEEEPAPTEWHRPSCEKCHLQPAANIWAVMNQNKKRKRKRDELSNDEIQALGSWVECGRCVVACVGLLFCFSCAFETQR